MEKISELSVICNIPIMFILTDGDISKSFQYMSVQFLVFLTLSNYFMNESIH